MKKLLLLVLFVSVFLFGQKLVKENNLVSSTPNTQDLSPEVALEKWELLVSQNLNSYLVSAPTLVHQYRGISYMTETQELIKQIRKSPELEVTLLQKIQRRCEGFKSDETRASNYYSHLFCEVKGISVSNLLFLASANEQVLDHIVHALFSQGETDRSKWSRVFKLVPLNGSRQR